MQQILLVCERRNFESQIVLGSTFLEEVWHSTEFQNRMLALCKSLFGDAGTNSKQVLTAVPSYSTRNRPLTLQNFWQPHSTT
jgi:hypothetical protein